MLYITVTWGDDGKNAVSGWYCYHRQAPQEPALGIHSCSCHSFERGSIDKIIFITIINFREKQMTNKDFFLSWKEICELNKTKIINLYENQQYKDYTKFILNNDKSVERPIIEQIAEKLELKYYSQGHGYYFIDAVLYKENDLLPSNTTNNTWSNIEQPRLRRIRISFEHEMEPNTIWQEICHLLIVNSDHKIIVTYDFYKNQIKVI
jgi:hypothetical protein